MKLSIGVLAHNESNSIAKLLNSFRHQSLFTNASNHQTIELIIVTNGCTDNTAEIARKTLRKLEPQLNKVDWQWKICEVSEAGKSNAWNLFVHQFSAPNTDYFCLMDADIRLYHPDTLTNMLDILVRNPEYWVSLDRPIKDIELKQDKTWIEKLSVAVSKSSNKDQLYICGQLYCSRAEALRNMWMPAGLPVEDGFLTGMIVSENFTLKHYTFSKRIVRVSEASHVFEAYTNPLELINHEVRVVVGVVINMLLSCYLKDRCHNQLTAGTLIARMNQENHLWLEDFMHQTLATKNWWIIPLSLVFRRYRSLKNHSLLKALLRIPIATVAFLVDLSVFVRANNKLRGEAITSYW